MGPGKADPKQKQGLTANGPITEQRQDQESSVIPDELQYKMEDQVDWTSNPTVSDSHISRCTLLDCCNGHEQFIIITAFDMR